MYMFIIQVTWYLYILSIQLHIFAKCYSISMYPLSFEMISCIFFTVYHLSACIHSSNLFEWVTSVFSGFIYLWDAWNIAWFKKKKTLCAHYSYKYCKNVVISLSLSTRCILYCIKSFWGDHMLLTGQKIQELTKCMDSESLFTVK